MLDVWVVQADTQSGTRCGLTLDRVGCWALYVFHSWLAPWASRCVQEQGRMPSPRSALPISLAVMDKLEPFRAPVTLRGKSTKTSQRSFGESMSQSLFSTETVAMGSLKDAEGVRGTEAGLTKRAAELNIGGLRIRSQSACRILLRPCQV